MLSTAAAVGRHPDHPVRRRPADRAHRQGEVVPAQLAHDRLGALQLAELVEHEPQPRLHLLVRVEDDPAPRASTEPRRQRQAQLAARRLLPLALVQAHPDLVQLGLAHEAGQAQRAGGRDRRRGRTIPLLDNPVGPMNARPEQITVTDPAHPLYGRVFSLVSLPSAPGPGSCAQVAYRGDIVLRIPVEATSLRPAAPGMPASKLAATPSGSWSASPPGASRPIRGRPIAPARAPTPRRARRHRPRGGDP